MKKLIRNLKSCMTLGFVKTKTMLCDCRGELATNTIGAIILAVVLIGLLIVAVNAFFPNFFTDMFGKMSDKLNSNW